MIRREGLEWENPRRTLENRPLPTSCGGSLVGLTGEGEAVTLSQT